jgi:hypothetical protein
MQDLATWISISSTLVAFASVVISYLVYASQVHPDIVVYTECDPKSPTLIYLVIANIGRSPARDIRFSPSAPIPSEAFGLTPEDAKRHPMQTMTDGPLISGIPFLAPGGCRRLAWGQYPGLFLSLGNKSIRIRAKYRSRQNDILDWQDHETESEIEIRSYIGTDCGDNDPVRAIARNLEKIGRTLEKQKSGNQALQHNDPG